MTSGLKSWAVRVWPRKPPGYYLADVYYVVARSKASACRQAKRLAGYSAQESLDPARVGGAEVLEEFG